jgi:hypothetical protein
MLLHRALEKVWFWEYKANRTPSVVEYPVPVVPFYIYFILLNMTIVEMEVGICVSQNEQKWPTIFEGAL